MELLGRLGWTRRLAAELVSDAGLAEDLVQDAWVQYLTRPPRAEGSWKAWFAQVLRNLARQQGRRAGLRGEVELEHDGHGEGVATVELVARAQAQRALVQHVLELDAPHRDVLLLRYFDELDSPAIAARLGIPASSVRTRLQRALELLRSRLVAGRGSESRDWLTGIVPLLPRPAGAGPSTTSTAAATGSHAALVWLSSAAALLALATGAWLFLGRSEPGAPARGSAPVELAAAAAPEELVGEVQAPVESGAAAGAGRSEVTPAAGGATGAREPAGPELVLAAAAATTLDVRVRIDGEPAAGGTVHLSTRGWIDLAPGAGRGELRAAPIGADGRARFADAPNSFTVGVEPAPGAPVLQRGVNSGRSKGEVTLELGTARLLGRVWDADGRPSAGVVVSMGVRIGNDYGALRGRMLSDSRGRFAFEGVPATSYWVHAEALGRGAEMRTHGSLERGEVREIELGRAGGSVVWSGRLVDERGDPATAREPRARRSLEFVSVAVDGQRACFPTELTADGGFSVELLPGDYEVRRRQGGDATSLVVAEQVAVTAEITGDLVLPGTTVHGIAYLAGRGTPFDPDQDGATVLQLSCEHEDGSTQRFESGVGPDGSYSFAGVGPGRWTVGGARLAEAAPLELVIVRGERERVDDVVVR